jgi:oligopeptide transport system substrate-binding protein
VIRSRRWLHAGVAILLAVAFLAWSNLPTSAQHAKKGLVTLRMGYMANNAQWTPTLDPAEVTDTTSGYLTNLMYEGLVGLKTVGKKVVVYPQLAAKMPTVSKNGKVYTFTLRNGLRFSNGDPITPADVVWSIRRANSPAAQSPVATYDALIKGWAAFNSGKSSSLGVKAAGANKVVITIARRAAYFLNSFTYEINNVLDKKVLNGKKLDSGGSYMTTTCKAVAADGQFKPVCASKAANDVTSFYRSGSTPTLTLVPNTRYHGRISNIKMVIPAIDSTQTSYNDYLSGNLDFTFQVPSSNQAQWAGKKTAYKYPISGIEYLAPNIDEAPFNNLHCRLALEYAIDRPALTNQVLHGAYKPLYTVVPTGFLGYYNGKSTPHFSLAKAKSELAQCPGGLNNVTYVYRNDTADRRASAPALQAMWKNAGINVQLKGEVRADWLKVILAPLSQSHTQLAYDDWFMDYPDPQDYIDVLLTPSHSEDNMVWNNAKYNKLVTQANAELNSKTRAKLYIQAQQIVLKQAVFIPLDNFTEMDLVSSKVKGMAPDYGRNIMWAKSNDWSLVSKS